MSPNQLQWLRRILKKPSRFRKQQFDIGSKALFIPDIVLAIAEVMPLADIVALALVTKFHLETLSGYLPKLNLPKNAIHRVNLLPRLRNFDLCPFRFFCMTCGRYHVWTDITDIWKPLTLGLQAQRTIWDQQDASRDINISSTTVLPGTRIQLVKRALPQGGVYLKSLDGLLSFMLGGEVSDRFFEHNIDFVHTRNNGLLLRIVSTSGPDSLPRPTAFRTQQWPAEIRAMMCDCDEQALGQYISRDATSAIIDTDKCRRLVSSCGYATSDTVDPLLNLPTQVRDCQKHVYTTE